jgi:hypothetical protein
MFGDSLSGGEDLPQQASEDQTRAFIGSLEERDTALVAVHRLEAAAATAGPGREDAWLQQVVADLRTLEDVFLADREEAQRPDSLLSMIARDYPRRFSSRIRQLTEQREGIIDSMTTLLAQLESVGTVIDVDDLRQRLGGLLQAIRDRWARETDLVYEAIRLDLGRGSEG